MEVLFAHTYLILFGKLAVGGLLALAVPPFFEMERGFYKSTASVYAALAFCMALGDAYLRFGYDAAIVGSAGLLAWLAFTAFFTAYVVTLFLELPRLRASLFPAAIAAGFVALAITAWGYVPEHASAATGIAFAASALAGAAAAGSAVTGMLLGHWYLIETGLDLSPLRRMWGFCRACVRVQIVVVLIAILSLWLWPGSHWDDAFAAAFGGRFGILLVGRIATWAVALVLLEMIGRTLAIPQTMAATGLFYIQALTVSVGEILSHWLLFRTGLPF